MRGLLRGMALTLCVGTLVATGLDPVAAFASTTATVVTRAQWTYDFGVANNITPVYPATPTFSDVPSSSPYYGYIEAEYQAGWIAGVGGGLFDPSGPLTRTQIAKIEVIALGDGAAAQALMNTPTAFTDNAQIPSWGLGYVAEAVKLGLVKGYPNGTFAPNQAITTADEPFFLAQYKAAQPSTSFTIAASPQDAAVGQAVTLSAAGTTGTVSYSVTSSNAAINGTTFIASQPGNYAVTGTTATGATASTVVHVFGAPTALAITAPSSITANGASETAVTVKVLDANGNLVANNQDSITLTSSNQGVATVVASPESASGGIATFTLKSGSVIGVSTTLTATDSARTPNLTATASVEGASQVATAIKVTAQSAFVENNDGSGTDVFTAVVTDQSGNPLTSGVYQINFSISGASGVTFSGGQTSYTTSYVGNSSGTGATVTVDAAQAATGSFTVTASTPTSGVSSGSASAQAVTVGAPAALEITQSATSVTADTVAASTSTATGAADVLTVTAVDAHGYPVLWTGTAEVTELINGSAGNLKLNGVTPNSQNGTVAVSFSSASSATVYVSAAAAVGQNAAGTYQFSASDNAGILHASSAAALTVTPGVPYQVSITSPAHPINVGFSSPTVTVTAQIADREGNPVAQSGVAIGFTEAGATPTETGQASIAPAVVTTNASGAATATLSVESYAGNTYTVSATGENGDLPAHNTASIGPITVYTTVPQTMTASLTATATGSSQVEASQSGNVTLVVLAYNQYNAQSGSDQVTVTSSAGLNLSTATTIIGSAGTYNATSHSYTVTMSGGEVKLEGITASTIGTQTVNVVDISSPSGLETSTSISVVAGGFSQFLVVNNAGQNLALNATYSYTPFTAGQSTPVNVQPSDASGNPSPSASAETVYLSSSAGNYTFETTSGTPLTYQNVGGKLYFEITFAAGQGSQQVLYVNTTGQGGNLYDNLSAQDTAP